MGPRPPSTYRQPDVIVDFEHTNGCLFVVITNIGSEPAHSIATSFEPTFHGLGGCRPIPSLGLFDNIGFLPPGKAIRAFVDVADSYLNREEPAVIQTDVSFQDNDGRSFTNHATHDLEIYRDLPHLEPGMSTEIQPDSGGGPGRRWGSQGHPRSIDPPSDVPSRSATFELYEDQGGQYRWRLVHPNGNIIADSGEGYASKQKAKQGIASVRENAGEADIEDRT